MLYRHFPKIANKDFSILTLSLAAMNPDLVRSAAGLGINLLAAGSDPAVLSDIARGLQDLRLSRAFSLAFEFRGKRVEDLDTLIRAARVPGTDQAGKDQVNSDDTEGGDHLLLIYFENEETLTGLAKNGILTRAESAKRGGQISGYGFACPNRSALICSAIEAWSGWDFFSTDCHYLIEPTVLQGGLARAAEAELGCLATNPFAGGILENQSPAVHQLFRNAPVPRSHDEWALRSIWERQEIVSVAWQAPDPDQLTRKAIFAEAGRPNSLPGKELAVLEEAAKLSGYQT